MNMVYSNKQLAESLHIDIQNFRKSPKTPILDGLAEKYKKKLYSKEVLGSIAASGALNLMMLATATHPVASIILTAAQIGVNLYFSDKNIDMKMALKAEIEERIRAAQIDDEAYGIEKSSSQIATPEAIAQRYIDTHIKLKKSAVDVITLGIAACMFSPVSRVMMVGLTATCIGVLQNFSNYILSEQSKQQSQAQEKLKQDNLKTFTDQTHIRGHIVGNDDLKSHEAQLHQELIYKEGSIKTNKHKFFNKLKNINNFSAIIQSFVMQDAPRKPSTSILALKSTNIGFSRAMTDVIDIAYQNMITLKKMASFESLVQTSEKIQEFMKTDDAIQISYEQDQDSLVHIQNLQYVPPKTDENAQPLSSQVADALEGANKINLDLQPNTYYELKGDSGTGKTVLINTLLHYNVFSKGAVNYSCKQEEIAFCGSEFRLMPELDILQAVFYPKEPTETDEDKAKAKEFLKTLGLNDELLKDEKGNSKLFKNCSAGEKSRIMLVAALLKKPKLLILDETLGKLDNTIRGEAEALIRSEIIDNNGSVLEVRHRQGQDTPDSGQEPKQLIQLIKDENGKVTIE